MDKKSILRQSLNFLFKDPVVLSLAAIPLVISLCLYVLVGFKLVETLLPAFFNWFGNQMNPDSFIGSVLAGILVILGLYIFLVIMGWTFLLVVNLISSPFNQLISDRVEKKWCAANAAHLPLNPDSTNESVWALIKRNAGTFSSTLVNETKKMLLAVIISLFIFILGLVPLFMPISFMLLTWLVSYQYLDYTFSRHNFTVTNIFKFYKSSFLKTTLAGAFFVFILSIPLVNLFISPLCTIFYTLLYCQQHQSSQAYKS